MRGGADIRCAEIDRERAVASAKRAKESDASLTARLRQVEAATAEAVSRQVRMDWAVTKEAELREAFQRGEQEATMRLKRTVEGEQKRLEALRAEVEAERATLARGARQTRDAVDAERRALREDALRRMDEMERERLGSERETSAALQSVERERVTLAELRAEVESERRKLALERHTFRESLEQRVTEQVELFKASIASREATVKEAEAVLEAAKAGREHAEEEAQRALAAAERAKASMLTAQAEAAERRAQTEQQALELKSLRAQVERLTAALEASNSDRDEAMMQASRTEQASRVEHRRNADEVTLLRKQAADAMARTQATAKEREAMQRHFEEAVARHREELGEQLRAFQEREAGARATAWAELQAAQTLANQSDVERSTLAQKLELASMDVERERALRIAAQEEATRLSRLLATARRTAQESGSTLAIRGATLPPLGAAAEVSRGPPSRPREGHLPESSMPKALVARAENTPPPPKPAVTPRSEGSASQESWY
jgi:hypothetical protein